MRFPRIRIDDICPRCKRECIPYMGKMCDPPEPQYDMWCLDCVRADKAVVAGLACHVKGVVAA